MADNTGWNNKKIRIVFIVFTIILILTFPVLANFLSLYRTVLPVAQGNDWIKFWGSYASGIIGGVLGGIFTYLGVKITLDKQESDQLSVVQKHQMMTLTQLQLILPFRLNLPEELMFITGNERKIITLIFSTSEKSEKLNLGFIGDIGVKIDASKTRVEMIYLTQNKIMEDDESPDQYFSEMLYILNSFILSYVISQKDNNCYKVTREMLNISSVYAYFHTSNWNRINEVIGIKILHSNIPIIDIAILPKLKESNLNRIDVLTSTILKNANPYLASQESIHTAKRYLRIGFYREAVIFSQISIETFISATLDVILSTTLVDEADKERIEQMSFHDIIPVRIHDLGPFFGFTEIGQIFFFCHIPILPYRFCVNVQLSRRP